jgi:hypothetical protein
VGFAWVEGDEELLDIEDDIKQEGPEEDDETTCVVGKRAPSDAGNSAPRYSW